MESVTEQGAVGQPGQGIVMGELLQSRLVFLLHADVGKDSDIVVDLALAVFYRGNGQ
ncbi:MAG: hypothetical protein ACD_10C00727G0006 [uncultured bacterium]|nr:MAG: hypothetical protein ACD_10C00727G0006 [uncultured bacterium]